MKKLNKNKLFIIINISIFVILTILVLTKVTNQLDTFIENTILNLRNPKLTNLMTNITNIGGAYSLCAISLLLLFIMKNKKDSIKIIINLITVFLSSQLLKIIIRRDRPLEIYLISATGYSYPSGHMMVSTAFFLFLNHLILKNNRSNLFKVLSVIITIVLITLIGFSRIYLGVHYFTDILGGFLLGLTHYLIFISIIDKIMKVKAKK